MAIASFNTFDSREELAKALSENIAARLLAGIEESEFPSLALSGGGTPKLFLQKLGDLLGDQRALVYLTPVDERFVPSDHKNSNERMMKECLGVADHPDSEMLSLADNGQAAQDVAMAASKKLMEDDEVPFEVLTLGMGLDGHTASFFPGSPELHNVASEAADFPFQAITRADTGETRITMTLPVILSANYTVLHIEGADKREVYEQALAGTDIDEMPVRAILHHEDAEVHVFWAP